VSLPLRGVVTAGIMAMAGCHRAPPPIDVMTISACDSTPHPTADDLTRRARAPNRAPVADMATIVGLVREQDTGVPVTGGRVFYWRSSATSEHAPAADLDSLGGFVLPPLPPGSYVVRVTAFNHTARNVTVVARRGAVDTVSATLRFFTCFGY
jgi:hypothetical protein